ncbi:MAG TPA: SDR family oxidoreductase [Gammaproteobacteria bacterium]|nr:SDR family oxidoreductase [Gammaproteobacteria bacterium]
MGENKAYLGTPFDLTGKTALVTGGAGLLGREFCLALRSAGADVIMADIDRDVLDLAIEGVEIDTQLIDVTDQDSIERCIASVTERHKGIDILVNSAAIDSKFESGTDLENYTQFTNFPYQSWQESMKVNIDGLFLVTQAVCRVMEKMGEGSIINLGSNYGLVGPDQRIYKEPGAETQAYKPPVYSTCKAAILGFTKYLAAYYAGTKIRVNMLTPSGVFNNHEAGFSDRYAKRTIMRRMSDKEEYHGPIIFLASNASSYMTGTNLIVDGGWTAL